MELPAVLGVFVLWKLFKILEMNRKIEKVTNFEHICLGMVGPVAQSI